MLSEAVKSQCPEGTEILYCDSFIVVTVYCGELTIMSNSANPFEATGDCPAASLLAAYRSVKPYLKNYFVEGVTPQGKKIVEKLRAQFKAAA